MNDLEKYDECHRCGKEFDPSRFLSECQTCLEKCHHEEDATCSKCIQDTSIADCPRNCGEHTVCKRCAEFEGHKCQRCRQDFYKGSSVEDEGSELRNWKRNFEGTADLEKDYKWHFKCLDCGQLHKEWSSSLTVFLVPVNSDGEPTECIRFPKMENGVCQDCGNKSEHAENCRFWKARKELKEVSNNGGG